MGWGLHFYSWIWVKYYFSKEYSPCFSSANCMYVCSKRERERERVIVCHSFSWEGKREREWERELESERRKQGTCFPFSALFFSSCKLIPAPSLFHWGCARGNRDREVNSTWLLWLFNRERVWEGDEAHKQLQICVGLCSFEGAVTHTWLVKLKIESFIVLTLWYL